ncbi:hypothetical protein MRB53_034475 [Persea americana]|uniref:Uncharacterized protein n=1 Tax=Persea americana TaxID=3435 RepID=A0ACC2K2F7_PERAE|nr:hypothetical protein MRB53_034475 [Persea americana]
MRDVLVGMKGARPKQRVPLPRCDSSSFCHHIDCGFKLWTVGVWSVDTDDDNGSGVGTLKLKDYESFCCCGVPHAPERESRERGPHPQHAAHLGRQSPPAVCV